MTDYEDIDMSELVFETPSSVSDEEELAVLVLLMLLKKYYDDYKSLSPEQILSRVEEDMPNLKTTLSNTAINQMEELLNDAFDEELNEWNIPTGTLKPKPLEKEVISVGMFALVNHLRDSLINKCTYTEAYGFTPFNINPQFKEAITKIAEIVNNNALLAKERNHREILRFVYGNDMLYYWVCRNDPRTCAICRAKSRENPKPLDEWDYDHPYGRCTLVPVEEIYSEEYKAILNLL